MKPLARRGFRCVGSIALVIVGAIGAAPADEGPPKDPWNLKLFRFEFDNDTFFGSDDAFSAGWSVQIHSRLCDTWNPAFAGWVGRIPGLGDDSRGGRIARWGYGITQLILTPEDVSIAAPQPNQPPWAGVLGVYITWSSYDNRRLAALQPYLGCMGPCSQAEDVQKFIHEDLGLGTPPAGWSNQLANQLLANLNYEFRYKLWADDEADYAPGRFGNDLSAGLQVGLGNLATLAFGWLEYRFGWGMPQGFTKTADPPAFGIALDPVYLEPEKPLPDLRRWRAYLNVVTRGMWIGRFAPLEGGETENGGFHPGLDLESGSFRVLFGAHVVKLPIGVHLTYYRYFDDSPQGTTGGDLDWINLAFEARF